MTRRIRKNWTPALSGLGEVAADQRNYWRRFLAVAWGWPVDRINGSDGAYIRPQVEDTLRNEASRYIRSQGTSGWFAARPDEYAMYVSEYGGDPGNFTIAAGTPVYQPTEAAAVAVQYHAAEQGNVSAFNQGPLSVLPPATPAPNNSPFSLGPVAQASNKPPVSQPVTGGGSGSAYYPAAGTFPEVGAGSISTWEPQPQTGPTHAVGGSDNSKLLLAALSLLALTQ